MKKLACLINNKDRPTELVLLLQSLRTQTFQDFDIFILDDYSGTPLNSYYFINLLITRMKLENHDIKIDRTEFPHGVSRARQRIVEMAKGYEYLLRVDDDCILEPDYIERLFNVIDNGYDMATGVTIPLGPIFKREPKFLKGVINRIILDKDGNFIFNGDDCGMAYTESVILPAHHFRSCALYKSKIHEKVNYYPTRLTMNGYREEEIFSLKMLIEGFKIGCDTQAVNYHLMTPSGGERNTMNLAPLNQQVLLDFVKENKDLLIPLTSKIEDLEPDEYKKENNLLR
jgi:GT2 family glycosyltransferase